MNTIRTATVTCSEHPRYGFLIAKAESPSTGETWYALSRSSADAIGAATSAAMYGEPMGEYRLCTVTYNNLTAAIREQVETEAKWTRELRKTGEYSENSDLVELWYDRLTEAENTGPEALHGFLSDTEPEF